MITNDDNEWWNSNGKWLLMVMMTNENDRQANDNEVLTYSNE